MLIFIGIVCLIIAFVISAELGKELSEKGYAPGSLFFIEILLTAVAIGFLISGGEKRSFPADEYKIEYKITTFEGQSDTTYVLIRK